jgi:hypothetical protein
MADKIPVGRTVGIKDCGYDEFWLRDQIVASPACLGLGELEVIAQERRQAHGARLDLLLKDPEDDSMYEVELMLGETDESHIVRTIEYWDNERRRWPQRQHFAVLIAESITRRFFNVVQLLSQSIPMIAIQVSVVEADSRRLLHFSKVLDIYEEPDENPGPSGPIDEEHWRKASPWTLEIAKAFSQIVRPTLIGSDLNFVQSYIAIAVNQNNYFIFHKRASNRSIVWFWLSESALKECTDLLEKHGMPYVRKRQSIRLTIDKQTVESNSELFARIATLVDQSWKE